MNYANVNMVEAKRIANNVPYTLCTVNSINSANNIKTELKQNGINCEFKENTSIINKAPNNYEKFNNNPGNELTYERDTPVGCFKRFITLIEIVCAIALLFFIFSSKGFVVATDLMAYFNEDGYDNPYIEMVHNHKPFNDGNSYVAAFAQNFDSNTWTYFKSDNGQRIVQVISTYNDITDDEMITQFIVTPTDEKGQFLIEPYAMRVSGQDLSNYEMNIVLAAIFENDVINALGELFLYSLLS